MDMNWYSRIHIYVEDIGHSSILKGVLKLPTNLATVSTTELI